MNTSIWLIRFTDSAGQSCAAAYASNAIADFRDVDPAATAEKLDVLALADLLCADRLLDQVIADARAHHEHVARNGYVRVHAPMTRELCERYVAAEMDRANAIERCSPSRRQANFNANGEVTA